MTVRLKLRSMGSLLPLLCLSVLLGAPAPARAVPQLQLDVTSVAFPATVMVGLTTSALRVRMTSSGSDVVKLLRWKLTGSHPADFRVGGCALFQGEPVELSPGEWCDAWVEFVPTAPGARSAVMLIDTTAPAQPQVLVSLSGNATAAAPDIRVTPASLSFGVKALQVWSAPLELQIKSVGTAQVVVQSVTVDDPAHFSVAHVCTVLAAVPSAHTSCTVEVRFRPSAAGPMQTRLRVASNDPDGTVEVPLSGIGGGPKIGLPSPLVFGSVEVGKTSTPRLVVISNLAAPGTGRLHVTGATPSGAQAADFTVAELAGCADVGEGQSCSLSVVFGPRESGPSSATLNVTSDSGGVAGTVSPLVLTGFGEFIPSTVPLPPLGNDHDFAAAGAPFSCAATGTPIGVTVPVTRAFGSRNPSPGPPPPQPTLAAAVASGALASTATLQLMVFHEGPAAAPRLVSFNGTVVGPIAPPPHGWSLQTVTVPATSILFAAIGSAGLAPTPAANLVTLLPASPSAGGCASIAWARVAFKAVSPVIFVHGNGSNGAFFVRQGAAGALNAAGIPNDTTINLAGGGAVSVAANAAALQGLIRSIVRSFGVDSVHLVTHSKGGLDSRLWLSLNAAANAAGSPRFVVLSVTTLGTPHRGSPLADLQLALAAGAIGVGGIPVTTLGGLGVSPASGASLDLSTFANASFNPPLPPAADYRMIAADADLLLDRLILSAPIDEYAPARSEQPFLAALFASEMSSTGVTPISDGIVTTSYNFLFMTHSVVVVPVILPLPIPFLPPGLLTVSGVAFPVPGVPMPNDLLVRADSALGGPPPFLPAGLVLGDHAAVGGTAVGAAIVPLVIATDLSRGDLK